jgi:DNA-binding NarL/FixJ family response regulator
MNDARAEQGESAELPLTVLIVDDHGVVRQGMRAYLSMVPDIVVIGEAVDGQQALDRLQTLAKTDALPDVVLMDILMPRMDGIAATAAIKAQFPLIDVVVLTSFIEEAKVQAALEAGATGYLLKDAEADQVAAAVRAAHRGELQLDPAIAARLMRSLRMPIRADPLAELTEREREVLTLIAQGQANKAIAVTLGITERTARTHVSNILGKLGLASRTQAALFAVREGLVEPLPT